MLFTEILYVRRNTYVHQMFGAYDILTVESSLFLEQKSTERCRVYTNAGTQRSSLLRADATLACDSRKGENGDKAQNECRLVAKYNLVVEFSVKLGCVVSTPLCVA